DDGCGAFHGILHVGALEQLVDEHKPFLFTTDLHQGVAYALHLIEEIAFPFGDVVDYVDVAEDTVKKAQPHAGGRRTHPKMSQEYRNCDGADESALSCHIRPREKEKVGGSVQLDIIRHRGR